jgi:tetratricopeptide (TPR) repeat protein
MTAALLALAAAIGAAGTPGERFAEANARHEAGDFDGAARVYEALVAEGLESPALHVNLGAARLRAGRRGAAIASFERALRLDPRDADARANLAAARGTDRTADAGRSLLARIAARTPDGWATAAFAVPWTIAFLAAALRRRTRGRARPALGAFAAVAVALAAAGLALLAARIAERRAPVAIVIAGDAPLRSGAEEALRPTLALPEGTEVRIVEARGDAARVSLPSGLEGWVRAKDLERL